VPLEAGEYRLMQQCARYAAPDYFPVELDG
jgi:hypothetical protein